MFSKIVCIVITFSTVVATDIASSKFTKCFQNENIFNCSGQELLTLPETDYIPSNIATLDVSFNNLVNISFLNYHELSYSVLTLNLSHNRISVISSNAFKSLNNTLYLDLSNNLVSGHTLKDMDLSDLRRLRHLKLSHNPLKVIHSDTFNFLEYPSVTYLDLTNCEIKELESESMEIRSLEYLDLSWNQLAAFKESSFHMMPSLKTLDLSHNWITVLNEMPYMPELIILSLDNNAIETIAIKKRIEDFSDNLQELYLR
ncbi:chaoptin-like [Ruditapes philippinarum]|uniref:chaoptin-like n=1 Tax=Ruditapes philippinarum TaxID=129788 RepID=UPI00295A5DA5|nr:chaoptin-like [Ruditapes philippinarum]